MEDPIKAWVTESYDTMLALDDKLEEFELDMGDGRKEIRKDG